MKNKGQMDSGSIIAAVVIIILTVVFIAVIADLVDKNVNVQTQRNEVLISSNVTAVQLDHPDLTANASCNCTPYLTSVVPGTILWGDVCASNGTVCNYTYRDANYIDNATARTISDLLVVMFAVFVLVAIVTVLIVIKMR